MRKGLEVNLFWEEDEYLRIEFDDFERLLLGYRDLRNVRINVSNPLHSFIYIRVDGEKEQFKSYR